MSALPVGSWGSGSDGSGRMSGGPRAALDSAESAALAPPALRSDSPQMRYHTYSSGVSGAQEGAWFNPSSPTLMRHAISAASGEDSALSVPEQYTTAKRPDRDYGTCQYDAGDSVVHQQHRRAAAQSRSALHRRMIGLLRWGLALLIGVVTACIASFINTFEAKISDWKFERLIAHVRACGDCALPPFAEYAGVCAGLAAVAALFVAVVPVAGGSGIPEIKCYLNGVKIPGVLRAETLVAKATGVLFSVAAGLPCGKEGPMIHSGAIVGAGLSQGQSRYMGFSLSDCVYADLRNDAEKRDFVSCGAAAGVSAAFGAPIGGLLFAIEEGCSFWKPELIWRIFFSSIVSAFMQRIFLAGNERGGLNAPGMLDFGDFSTLEGTTAWTLREVPIFIAIGVLGGGLGALFNNVNMAITRARTRGAERLERCLRARVGAGSRLLRRDGAAVEQAAGWRGVRVVEALCVSALCTGAAVCCVTLLPPACAPDVRDPRATGDDAGGDDAWRHLFCGADAAGVHNEWATLWLNPSSATLRTLFHTRAEFSPAVLAGFCALFLILTCVNYGVGVPSGLFVPSLVVGAAYGRLIGHLLKHTAAYAGISIGTYSLVGAASFLGGVCRITFSLTVILIEATRDISYAIPLMITIMAAKFTGDRFSKGIYDEHIEYRKVPFLEAEIPEDLGVSQMGTSVAIRDLVVSDIMSPPQAAAFGRPDGPAFRMRLGTRIRCNRVDAEGAGRGWATVRRVPLERDRYVVLQFDGGATVDVTQDQWENAVGAEMPQDREKPGQLFTLPPVCRVSRILDLLQQPVCSFPVVAKQQEDHDEGSTDEYALVHSPEHDGLITRTRLFVLLEKLHYEHRADPRAPTFHATRRVYLEPGGPLAADSPPAPAHLREWWEELRPVRERARLTGWLHCRDKLLRRTPGGLRTTSTTSTTQSGSVVGSPATEPGPGMVSPTEAGRASGAPGGGAAVSVRARTVYWNETCEDRDAAPGGSLTVPSSWIRNATYDAGRHPALPYSAFVKRYPCPYTDFDSVRTGKERLGLRRLKVLREAITAGGAFGARQYVDLRPYMNTQPYVVPDNFSFLRAYSLFRAVGMRHMLVIDSSHRIRGIITRSDLYKAVHVAEALHHGHRITLQEEEEGGSSPCEENEVGIPDMG